MAKLPKISMRVHGGMPPATCVELAKAADTLGFETVWFAENMFNRGVLPAVTAAALATSRIKVGIGVFNPYNRHPSLIAMEIGALDEISGCRARLGIGSGAGDAVGCMGLSYDKPGSAMRDAVNIVRAMLRGERVTYKGNVFSVHDLRMEYAAPRPDFPIYLAAMGDGSLRIVGEVADGLMISNLSPPAFTARALEIVAKSAAKSGRPMPADVIQYVPCVVRADREEARRVVKETIGALLGVYWSIGETAPAFHTAITQGNGIPLDEFVATIRKLQAGEAPTALLDDRYIDAYAIAGNAEDCMAAVERFGAIGVTELVLTFVGSQPAPDMTYFSQALGLAR